MAIICPVVIRNANLSGVLPLTPPAYCYLRHPVLSSEETMLQYAIQHLRFRGSICLEKRRVPAHVRRPHARGPSSRARVIVP